MERVRERRPVSALLLSAILALGGVFSWTFGVGIIYAFVSQWKTTPVQRKSVVVTADGRALQQTYGRYGYDHTYETASGTPVDPTTVKLNEGSVYLRATQSKFHSPRNLFWGERIVSTRDRKNPNNYWYLICDNQTPRRGYVVGYNGESKQRLGYIGLKGFRENLPPVDEQFSVSKTAGLFENYAGAGAVQGCEPSNYRVGDSTNTNLALISDGKLLIIDVETDVWCQVTCRRKSLQ